MVSRDVWLDAGKAGLLGVTVPEVCEDEIAQGNRNVKEHQRNRNRERERERERERKTEMKRYSIKTEM